MELVAFQRKRVLEKMRATHLSAARCGELVLQDVLDDPYSSLSNEQRDELPDVIAAAVEQIRRDIGEPLELGPPLPPRPVQPPPSRAQHWRRYAHHLKEGKGWEEGVIEGVDIAAGRVVARLPRADAHDGAGRGLVLGYVQSGKTANMMAVIAKAADVGINFVVILAGLTDALRRQTQSRIFDDLVVHAKRYWGQLTTAQSDFDDDKPVGFLPLIPGHVRLAVVKKNRFVLEKLSAKLAATSPPNLKRMRALIIDDECDQASVNGARRPEDISAINRLVREMLALLPHHAYVGYTATPFANVLIDPTIDPSCPEDLYPRDFILSLPRPREYFGAEQLFGRGLIDADELDEPIAAAADVLRDIPGRELGGLRPPTIRKRRDGTRPTIAEVWTPSVTPTLEDAVAWFLMATAIRDLRGHLDQHSSMLIHTTVRTLAHGMLAGALQRHLHDLRVRLDRGEPELVQRWGALYAKETAAVPPCSDHASWDFEDVLRAAIALLSRDAGTAGVEVAIENSVSEQRLDYQPNRVSGDTYGRRYIVVGGNVLARGLTIEGLTVSFFLRTSNQYDTLMQMGRWFGYRKGYEDLPRIWMTARMADAFRQIATVEAEIREDIRAYSDADGNAALSPMEFAVRIRHIPGMLITARTKMRAARQLKVSWSGQHIQTRRFKHRDAEWLAGNLRAAGRLLENAGATREVQGGRCWLGVPSSLVLRFLEEYMVHEHHVEFEPAALLGFARKLEERWGVSAWNVSLVEPMRGNQAPHETLPISGVRMVNRAKFEALADGGADIKALMSRTDVLLDVAATRGVRIARRDGGWRNLKVWRDTELDVAVPLVVLYVIDPASSPRSEQGNFKPLEAERPVLGLGLVFPHLDDAGDRVYYAVDLGEAEPDEELDAIPTEVEGD